MSRFVHFETNGSCLRNMLIGSLKIERKQKNAQSSAEDERSWNGLRLPVPKKSNSSLRQPGCPECGIRGFASPDFSGFALSEIFTITLVTAKL